MSNIAIKVENLSKCYRIGLKEEIHNSLIGKITSLIKSPFSNLRRLHQLSHFSEIKEQKDIIWALKDVFFEIEHGEVLGIIGANGAGKSTLLKIISKITEPTSGRIELSGKVSSLLEVGTGMHSELTGRENIYLNGTILGMTKNEIEKKFDEIVYFSGVGKFIDTPVKKFSSGMSLRLGFAVAAHLDTEILLVDEVLAVGDVQFRKKCLEKMRDVGKEGKTVLFVSHNLSAIRQFCNRCILIDQGNLKEIGPTEKVVQTYLNQFIDLEQKGFHSKKIDYKKNIQLMKARTRNIKGIKCSNFSCDEPVIVQLKYNVNKQIPGLYGYLEITRDDGINVLVSISNDMIDDPINNLPVGNSFIEIIIPARILGHGKYYVTISLASSQNIGDALVDTPGIVATFILDDYSTTRGNDRHGLLSTICDWKIKSK